MDLNALYARHQRLIMIAALVPAREQRARSLDKAGDCARSITQYQLDQGASAAAGWALSASGNAPAHLFLKEYRP